MRLGYKPEQFTNPGYVKASMRPRHMRLGYGHIIDAQYHWYYSFNEAEAYAPRIPIALPGKQKIAVALQ